MDYQYYKRLLISIVGIYSVYLNYGLVQERMSSLSFLLHLLDIVMLVPMVVDSPIPPYFYFSNARLTSSLLLSVRFDFIQFYIKVLSSLISERSHLIFKFRKPTLWVGK